MSRLLPRILVIAVIAQGCAHGQARLNISDAFRQAPPRCVAVLPLENLSLTSLAGLSVGELLAAELERTGRFVVMEPTAYRYIAMANNLGGYEPTDSAMLKLFREQLGVDAIIAGSLTEYWYTDDPEVYRDKQPSVAFTLRMIDTADGGTYWNGRFSRTPGGLSSGISMISRVSAEMAESLAWDLVESIEQWRVENPGSDVPAPAMSDSPFQSMCKFEELLVADLTARSGTVAGSTPPRVAQAVPQLIAQRPELSSAATELMEKLKRGESFVLRGVTFVHQDMKLQQGNPESLMALGELLKGFPDLVVSIIVHSDNQGDPEDIRDMTQQQAEALRDILVDEHSATMRQIKIQGRGGDEPLLPNINRRNRQINRRVELQLATAPAGGW